MPKKYESPINFDNAYFYPIGWSYNSDFAYISYLEDLSEAGSSFASLIIYNVKSDSNTTYPIWNTMDTEKEGTEEYITSFDSIWNKRYTKIQGILMSHKIYQKETFSIDSFCLDESSNRVTFSMELIPKVHDDYNRTDSVRCIYTRLNDTIKVSSSGDWNSIQVIHLGFLTNPFTNETIALLGKRLKEYRLLTVDL